jgi:hypothetical protein
VGSDYRLKEMSPRRLKTTERNLMLIRTQGGYCAYSDYEKIIHI